MIKIVKAPAGLQLMTSRSVANALTCCAKLLDIKFVKEKYIRLR